MKRLLFSLGAAFLSLARISSTTQLVDADSLGAIINIPRRFQLRPDPSNPVSAELEVPSLSGGVPFFYIGKRNYNSPGPIAIHTPCLLQYGGDGIRPGCKDSEEHSSNNEPPRLQLQMVPEYSPGHERDRHQDLVLAAVSEKEYRQESVTYFPLYVDAAHQALDKFHIQTCELPNGLCWYDDWFSIEQTKEDDGTSHSWLKFADVGLWAVCDSIRPSPFRNGDPDFNALDRIEWRGETPVLVTVKRKRWVLVRGEERLPDCSEGFRMEVVWDGLEDGEVEDRVKREKAGRSIRHVEL
ncbi:hypothetical protein BJ508DRAFT_333950 [Ascobolus immersus RN42]|uniref:Uncharacterized protein n=1 Tax=Ascobolus immersus RN42 TaxID=1160509 RepID=A0A3N4HKZ6_ASCIM|nr:hypothetical protein BJ508DRAFT_333950 [Ascobolus immersus RN42]